MFCPGNHEATCDEGTPHICPDGQRNFTSYRQRYRMPARESGAVNNMWFSFVGHPRTHSTALYPRRPHRSHRSSLWSPVMCCTQDFAQVHFVSIDTEVAYPGSPEGPGTPMNGGPFGDQLAWLEADLKKAVANRANVPWILVAGHRPFYSSTGESGVWDASRPAFEPLFNKYSVDIVYWGHVHWSARAAAHRHLTPWPPSSSAALTSTGCVCVPVRVRVRLVQCRYERMYPTLPGGVVQQKSYADATAPIYFISASTGNVEGLTPGNATREYTAFLDNTHFGLGVLTVHNATVLDWDFYNSATRQLIDHVTITKTKRWEALHPASTQPDELAVKAE